LPANWILRNGYLIGPGANLTSASLTSANLAGAVLTNANLTGANLTNAVLTNANLTNANLTNANLTDANLIDAGGNVTSGAFVSCGIGGDLGTGITGTPRLPPSGWTFASGTLTAPNVLCAIAPSTQTVSGTAGTALPSTRPFIESGFTNFPSYTYTVAPTLPAGLQLNAVNGVVSGTPVVAQGATTYTITATSGAETATATITITIAAAPTPTPTPDPGPAPAPAPVEPAAVVNPGSTQIAVVGDPVPVVEVITPTQQMVNEVINLSPTQVQNLTANQLSELPAAAFAAMTPSQIKALNPTQVKQLSAEQIAAISPAAIRAMKPRTLRAFTPTQTRALTTTQVTELRVKQIRALGPTKKRIVTRTINISNR
jgi:hypothetical protein